MGNPIDFPPRTRNTARPGGVTASAVVCLLGGAVALGLAGLLVVAAFTPPPVAAGMPALPADYANLMGGSALLVAAFGALGIATGVGVLKLRPWARASILVFGAVMAVICLGAMLMLFVVTLPVFPGSPAMPDGLTIAKLRAVLLVVYCVPFLIGVWWLVQFNRPGAKLAFGQGAALDVGRNGLPVRPLSITVIGVFFVASGAMSIVPAISGMPGMMFGMVVTGWAATMFYVVVAAIQITAGSGLLKLHETARVLTIAWVAIGIANSVVMAWVPGVRATVETYERTMGRMPAGQPPFDMVQLLKVMTPFSILIAAILIWFLVRRRSAFHERAPG